MNPAILALREADVRRGKAMLKLVTFLEANWGEWEYSPETDRLRFQGYKTFGRLPPRQPGTEGPIR